MTKVRTKQKGSSAGDSFDYDEFEKEVIGRLNAGAGLVGDYRFYILALKRDFELHDIWFD